MIKLKNLNMNSLHGQSKQKDFDEEYVEGSEHC